MNEQSWEQQAVDEILEIEKRYEVTLAKLNRQEELFQIASALNLDTTKIQQKGEELEAELWDIIGEMES